MTSAVLAGLVTVAVTVGGGACLRTTAVPDPVDHPAPVSTPQVSADHPAMTTVWRPR